MHMYPGLRQGGRYSTTGGKAVIRSVLEQYELETPEGTGVYWGTSQQMQHVEWADDMILFAESKEEAERNAKHIITATTSTGTGVNEDKNEVRVWGRSSKEDTVRIGQVDCGALKEKVKNVGI